MFCKTFILIAFVFALAPTRAFRRKSNFKLSAGTNEGDGYLPVCAKEIVKETCDMLIGGLKKGDSEKVIGWLPIDSIKDLMAANEESMVGLLNALGYPSTKMPTKEELAEISEESKQALQEWGMKIASNEEGEHYLSVACENICDIVKKHVEEKYILPPSSDIMGMTTSTGNFEWTIDVRPQSLNKLWKGGDMPNFEAGDSEHVYSAGAGSPPGNATASRQPEGPSKFQYSKWAIIEAVANLFRFYPEEQVGSAGSLLQTSIAHEVSQRSLDLVDAPTPVPEWKPEEAVKVGKKGITYVKQIIREMNLPGVQQQIREWFGVDDDATKAEVVRVMTSVIEVMKNVHYHYKGPTCKDNTFAYVYPKGVEGCTDLGSVGNAKACKTNAEGKYIYYLCDLYLKTDDGEKIETLVHEGSHHFSAYTDDVCSDHYFDKNTDLCEGKAYGRDTCAKLAKADAPRALKNADNHCYFVQAVADPDYTRGQSCVKGSRALSWFADSDGDCSCPADGPCHKGGTLGACPWSRSSTSSKYFSASCKDCKCETPRPKTTCPNFAMSSTPDSDGDCECPADTNCKSGDGNCPSYSQGTSSHYFRSTCTLCTCEARPKLLILVKGNVVQVTKEFTSISKGGVQIKEGLIGRVKLVDADKDAFILFDDPVESQWVANADFENLKVFDFHVTNKVKVEKAFATISGDKKTLSVNTIGKILKIDDDSDAEVTWDDIGSRWVSWKSFGHLTKVESASKDGGCAGVAGPDAKGDCRCPSNTKCQQKHGGKCLTTAGEESFFLFASSCTDCECHGSGKPVTPTDPTPIDDKPGKDDTENGSPFAHQSICAVLLSMFACTVLQ